MKKNFADFVFLATLREITLECVKGYDQALDCQTPNEVEAIYHDESTMMFSSH